MGYRATRTTIEGKAIGTIVAGMAIVLALPNQAQAAENATLLVENSRMCGLCEILYSKDGIRVRILKTKALVSLKPPNWQVQYFSPVSKRYYQSPVDQWKPNFSVSIALFRPGDTSQLKPVSAEKTKLLGLECKKYKLSSGAPDIGENKRSWQKMLVDNGEFWSIEDKRIPASATKAINRTLGLPIVPGLPLAFVCTNRKGESIKELRLLSVSTVKCAKADFEVPHGSLLVKSQEQVTETNKEDVLEFLGGEHQ